VASGRNGWKADISSPTFASMFEGSIEEVAAQAELLLASVVPGAICVPQDWTAGLIAF